MTYSGLSGFWRSAQSSILSFTSCEDSSQIWMANWTYCGVPVAHFPRSCMDIVFSDTPRSEANVFCVSPARFARFCHGSLSMPPGTGFRPLAQEIVATLIFRLR